MQVTSSALLSQTLPIPTNNPGKGTVSHLRIFPILSHAVRINAISSALTQCKGLGVNQKIPYKTLFQSQFTHAILGWGLEEGNKKKKPKHKTK